MRMIFKKVLPAILCAALIGVVMGTAGCDVNEQPVPTELPEITEAPADTPVATEVPTAAPTEAPTDTPTAEPTDTPTPEPTDTPTPEPTDTPSPEPTDTPTPEPTPTPTPTPTPSPEPTPVEYKKYFTMSFDDGITQDARVIEILKKYNMPCTFNINTGLYGVSWTWVADAVGKPGLSHLRFTEAQLKTGIYDGFDVEVHTLTHPSLAANYGNDKNRIIREVAQDAANIEKLTGTAPVGMAYPGGTENDTSDFVIKTILENTNIRFARMAVNAKNPAMFELPEYWMKWYPQASLGNISFAKTLGRRFINSTPADRDMLYYFWGHSYELDQMDSWDAFEEFVKMMSEAEDVICVTNAEFYELFKDKIPAYTGY